MSKQVTVYWSHLNHFKGTLEIPEGLSEEEEYKYVCDNIPYDTSASLDGGIPEKAYITFRE